MHEMALCESMLRIVADEARSHRFSKVRVVRLRVGAFSGVSTESMAFCFPVVARGTIADGARLEFEPVPGRGWCPRCETTVDLAERFDPCPHCGGHGVQVVGGDEFRISDLEVD